LPKRRPCTLLKSTAPGVVTQLPKFFEDRVGLGATGLFVGVWVGSSDEVGLGGQTPVVDLRQSLGHGERDGVRHIEKPSRNGGTEVIWLPFIFLLIRAYLRWLPAIYTH
jgi:hypothetical protein